MYMTVLYHRHETHDQWAVINCKTGEYYHAETPDKPANDELMRKLTLGAKAQENEK